MKRAERIQEANRHARAADGRLALRTRLFREAVARPDFRLDPPSGATAALDILTAVERMRRGEPDAVEDAIIFLEVDPWCFRSGYMKEDLLAGLRHIDLTERQKARLENVVVAALTVGQRWEFRQVLKTARALYTPALLERVRRIREDESVDEGSRRRTAWMSDALTRLRVSRAAAARQ